MSRHPNKSIQIGCERIKQLRLMASGREERMELGSEGKAWKECHSIRGNLASSGWSFEMSILLLIMRKITFASRKNLRKRIGDKTFKRTPIT